MLQKRSIDTVQQAFEGLRNASRKVRRPDCTLATVDHVRFGPRAFHILATDTH